MKKKSSRLFSMVLAACMLLCLPVGCSRQPDPGSTVSSGVTGPAASSNGASAASDTVEPSASDSESASSSSETTRKNTTTTTTRKPTTTTSASTRKPTTASRAPDNTTAPATTTTTGTQEEQAAMYVSWDAATHVLQVVHKYSRSEDFVMVLKPTGPNQIFNIAPPKFITNYSQNISTALPTAVMKAGMSESDWFGPHVVNAASERVPGWNQFTGGTHGASGNESAEAGPSGRSDNIVVKADGKTLAQTTTQYADALEVSWDTYVQGLNTLGTREILVEHHTMTFDGVTWQVQTDIEFLEDVEWRIHYGMQCVYGVWNNSIQYDGGQAQSIAGGNAATESNTKKCETMLLSKGTDHLEMYLDSTYGIGDRRYLNTDDGAFSVAYGDANNGKAYFCLVNAGSGSDFSMEKGQVVSYRGHYRFYSE